MKQFIFALFAVFLSFSVSAQSLHSERIWKVSDHKKSIYLDQGVFHWMSSATGGFQLKNVRSSYVPNLGYERIVFDFYEVKAPSIYGMIAIEQKKIYIDFFNTSLAAQLDKLKNAKYVSKVDVFTIDKKALSVEISLKEKTSFDIFVLENPGRLVIDIKK